jgi:CRISPR-associated protein Csd2
MSLTNKIDFAVVFSVKKANPNGDPLNGNRPRTDYDGFGEVSDVCLKRKIRNRLQDMGERILVQSDDRREDDYRSIKDRVEGRAELKKAGKDKKEFSRIACETWFDVRAFGQVFAFGKNESENAVSVGVRGPVSIHGAVSENVVDISTLQIVKSVNSETNKDDPDKKGSDTMGQKHRVDFGVYTTFGSINTQLAAKTAFSDNDAEKLLEALKTLFENDASSARPDGSMEVIKVYWWKHNCATGQYSSAKVHRTLSVKVKEREPVISCACLEGLEPCVYDGK